MGEPQFEIREMTIDDFPEVHKLWMTIKGFGIRTIDDSKKVWNVFPSKRNPSELGTSMAKLTILQATPYPDDASRPSLLINAHSARNDICVRNSCIASGSPTESNLLHCLFNLKSFLAILNGSFFLLQQHKRKDNTDRLGNHCCYGCTRSVKMTSRNQNKVTDNIYYTCHKHKYKR